MSYEISTILFCPILQSFVTFYFFYTKNPVFLFLFQIKCTAENTDISCLVCDASFPSIPELMSHYNSSHKLQCRLCRFVADSEKVLKLHYAGDHKEDKHWFCPLTGCSCNFKRKGDFKKHMENHVTYKKKLLHCPLCQFVSFRQDLLQKHCTDVHNEKKPFYCNRQGCTYKADGLSKVAQHIRERHTAVINVIYF